MEVKSLGTHVTIRLNLIPPPPHQPPPPPATKKMLFFVRPLHLKQTCKVF